MRVRKIWVALPVLMCLLAAGYEEAGAQEKAKQKKAETGVVVETDTIVVGPPEPLVGVPIRDDVVRAAAGGGDNTFVFVSSEMTIDGKVVKGAPYSAEAVTETTQVFADGNRIVRKNTAQVYRDGEGRTRRDQAIGVIGPFAAAGDPPQTVFIHDPVAGVNYILDPRTRTARKVNAHFTFERMSKPEGGHAPGKAPEAAAPLRAKSTGYTFTVGAPPPPHHHGGPLPDVMFYSHSGAEPKVESLGEQLVEGVKAEGKRVTVTIPAGSIGNEREINIVTERWYSPELQTVVMTRHSDPRFGETVYRLTNISRAEPARTLFEVPSDYTLKEGGAGVRTFRMKKGAQAGGNQEN